MHWHPRLLHRLKPSKFRTKYREDTIRHYDQRQAGFFINNILSQKKLSIPLR